MNSGAWIGIIVGIIVFIVLKTGCIVVLWRRRNQKDRSRILSNASSNAMTAQQTSELLSYIEKWEIRCDDVKLIRRPDGSDWELGSGAFGRVVKGLRGGVQEVAIKMLYKNNQKDQEIFLREISMLKFVARDRNVVQFYGVSIQNNGIWLITELMQGGDLRNALTADGAEQVTWWNRGKQIACDVAKGLAFLHSNKVIHRDLKSKNVLLAKDGEAKITDVGMAKLMSEAYYTQDNNIGTFAWAAPEILMGEKCSEKVDCYSLGVTIWEIATSLMPVRGKMDTPSVKDCPTEIAVLISDLMRRDPRVRPTAAEAYRRLKAAEPNPEIVPLPEDLADAPSRVVTGPKDYEACTWQTDLDSAGDNTNLMKIADGLSNDVTMMENSFMHLAVPERKDYMAGSYTQKEKSILNYLAKDPKTAAKQNPFNFNNTQAQARTGTNTEASGLMELAEDASAVVGNLEDSEVPMVDGGKARGIRLTPSQLEAISKQDGLPNIHGPETEESDVDGKSGIHSAQFPDSVRFGSDERV